MEDKKKPTIVMTILILIFLVVPNASAYSRINIYIDNIGDALFLGETDDESLKEILPSGIKVENGRISGYTSGLTSKEGDVWSFFYELENSELVAILPEGAVVKSFSAEEIFLEKRQIAIYTKEGKLSASYVIEKVANREMENLDVLFKIIAGLVILLLAVYLINFRKREKRKNKGINDNKNNKGIKLRANRADKIKILQEVLNDREKLILDKLQNLGRVKSSYLRKACDIPKASFSRHIRELERKGLVRLSGEGKNKIAEIKK